MVPVPGENMTQTATSAFQDELKREFDELFPYRNPDPPSPRKIKKLHRDLMFSPRTWGEVGRVRGLDWLHIRLIHFGIENLRVAQQI